jgi:TrmH family RNA methyltransferase
VARQFPTALSALALGPDPLLLVVEAIEKPGNLGTMLRTAEAAGAAAVIVCDPATDPFNPNVVRASLGTLFTVPLAVADTPGTIARLGDLGIRTVVTTPGASLPHWEADLTGPVAVVVGSEQYGLSAPWLAAADCRVVIPMPGSVDSLNAAMAAGIVLFEAVRQRADARG